MTNDVVGIPFKRHFRMFSLDPSIKRIVKKEVGQQRTDHPTLRRTSIPRHQLPGLFLHRALQPAFNVESRPWLRHVLCYRPCEKPVVDGVKEGFQVNIDDPRVTPAVIGQGSAFAQHLSDVDVTADQRSPNTLIALSHVAPLNGLSGEQYCKVVSNC